MYFLKIFKTHYIVAYGRLEKILIVFIEHCMSAIRILLIPISDIVINIRKGINKVVREPTETYTNN